MKGIIAWQRSSKDRPFQLPQLAIDLAGTALLVVDMQNKFSVQVREVVPNNLRLLNFFRENKLPVIFIRVGSLLPDAGDLHIKRRLTWLRGSESQSITICCRGIQDHDITEALKPLPAEPVIDKNSQGAFNSSAIDRYLGAMGVRNLVVTGVATSHCVEGTARDAADRGYNVILVSDACNDRERNKHLATMDTFGRFFGAMKTTTEVIGDLTGLLGTGSPA